MPTVRTRAYLYALSRLTESDFDDLVVSALFDEDITANGRSLVGASNYAAMRALLDLEVGTDFLSPAAIAAAYQPLDTDLSAIAALSSAADKLPYANGAGTWALADFSAAARTVLDDASVAAMLATLGGMPLAGGTFSGDVTFGSGINVILNTSTGTKIGAAADQKLGFFGATAVVQPTNIVAASGGAVQDTECRAATNALLTRLKTLGLIASS